MAAFGRFSQVWLRSYLGQTRRQLSAAADPEQAAQAAKTWKIISFVVAIPAVGFCMLNAYLKSKEHSHEHPEFIPYEHLRIRSKHFPWGDGIKSLFHNSHVNPLPDGYEDHK